MSNLCRTCLKVLSNDAKCFSLDSVSVGDADYPSLQLRNKLGVCVPELALDVLQHAVICSLCVEALNTSYLFRRRCLQTEQKILNFARHTGCTKDSIDVSELAHFTETNSSPMEEVVPLEFCTTQHFNSVGLQEIKIEPDINADNSIKFNSTVGLTNDFQMETNNLITSIPFNPELDVEVRGYNANTLNIHSYSDTFDPNGQHWTTYPYYCIYCQKRFQLLSQLQTHLKMHDMESRPLKCEMCERRFVRKDKLMLHMRIHTGEKPFKCTECERCFSRKDKLNNHMRTHTGEKPHQCILCQKSFARKDKMNLHMKSQHWIALSNLEITVVKNSETTNGSPQPVLIENAPMSK